ELSCEVPASTSDTLISGRIGIVKNGDLAPFPCDAIEIWNHTSFCDAFSRRRRDRADNALSSSKHPPEPSEGMPARHCSIRALGAIAPSIFSPLLRSQPAVWHQPATPPHTVESRLISTHF